MIAGPAFSSARTRARLEAFTRATAVPAFVMESPRGVADPSLGALSEVLAVADVVVLLGKALDFTLRFGKAPTLAADAVLVAVDADPNMLARSAGVAGARMARGIAAQPLEALATLQSQLGEGRAARAATGWADAVAEAISWRPPQWSTLASPAGGPVHPVELGRALQRWIDAHPNTVFVSDGGEIGQWAQASVRATERLINGVAGAIGPATPFAIAARAARPDAPVLAVMGDGTFGFHMAEFDTAIRHGLPFVAVVGNDDRWNAEYQIQLRAYGETRAHGCLLGGATRYDRVVQALGGHGEFVDRAGELDAAIARAFASGVAACVNVRIESVAAPTINRPEKDRVSAVLAS